MVSCLLLSMVACLPLNTGVCLLPNTVACPRHNMVVYQPPNMEDYQHPSTEGCLLLDTADFPPHQVAECPLLRLTPTTAIYRLGRIFKRTRIKGISGSSCRLFVGSCQVFSGQRISLRIRAARPCFPHNCYPCSKDSWPLAALAPSGDLNCVGTSTPSRDDDRKYPDCGCLRRCRAAALFFCLEQLDQDYG